MFLRALAALDVALDDNIERAQRMKARIAELQQGYGDGRALHDLVEEERGALIVQLLTESVRALNTHGHRLRQAEARALHAEGLTMEQIAKLFGVTRQRVSALLRNAKR